MTDKRCEASAGVKKIPRWADADIHALFDEEFGRIDPLIYTDEALYQQEARADLWSLVAVAGPRNPDLLRPAIS